MTLKQHDRIIYRSPFSNCEFPGVVTNVRNDGTVDIAVDCTGNGIRDLGELWSILGTSSDRIRKQ